METGKNTRSKAAVNESGYIEGTSEMGYWEFKKEICAAEGWQLRRIASQTYEVMDGKHQKMGIFRSRQGYFPSMETANDDVAPTERR
jgi:hypothetical protein